MSDLIFLFDLDSTITKKEILPTISDKIGKQKEMQKLTEATMQGAIPFKKSFLERVKILSNIDVTEVNDLVADIPLNESIANFIIENQDRCYIVTGNLDVWISGMMKKLGMKTHVFCSKAIAKDNKIEQIISIIDKELTAKQFVQPFVVIGDGDNDSGMAKYADYSVGFGGVRSIAPSLMRNIDFAFYDEKKCAEFLKSLL